MSALRKKVGACVVAILSLTMIVGLAGSASAEPAGGTVGTEGSTGTTPAGTTTPSNGPSTPNAPSTPTYGYYSFTSTPVGMAPGTGMQGGCAATVNNAGYIGYKWTFRYPYGMTREEVLGAMKTGTEEAHGLTRTSEKCLYEAQWTTIRRVCIISLDANIRQTAPAATLLAEKSYKTAFGNNPTLTNCLESPTVLDLFTDIKTFGRFTFDGKTTVQACVQRHFISSDGITGETPGDDLMDCTTPYTKPVPQGHWQLDCSGFTDYWHGDPSWNANDCVGSASSSGSTWVCSAAPTNNINGEVRNDASLFRSNEFNPVVYGVSSPEGQGIAVVSTATSIQRSAQSTPWNSFSTLPANNNNFSISRNGRNQLASQNGTASLPGVVNSGWDLAANWASDSVATATVTTAEYESVVDMTVQVVNVTGVNVNTGSPVVSTSITTVRTDASCYSQPLTTMFVRAVSSR